MGSMTCTDCPVGKFSSGFASTECANCEIGEYQDVTGANTCKICPAGTTTTFKGASSISQCVAVNNIPTVSEWGIIILSILLLITGTLSVMSYRKRIGNQI